MLYLLVSACTLTSCIEEYNADISAEDSNLLVVEGTICAAQRNKFYLTRTQALNSSATPQNVTGAKVSVRGSDGSEYQAQAASGYYACEIGQLNPDAEYYLHIEADGETYESEPQQPLRTEKIAEIRGVQNTPSSNIDVLITPADPFAPSEANYYMWTYDETWQVYPDYMTTMYYDTEIKGPVFISNPFPLYGWVDATGSTTTVGASTSYDNQHIRNLQIYVCTTDTAGWYISGPSQRVNMSMSSHGVRPVQRWADCSLPCPPPYPPTSIVSRRANM